MWRREVARAELQDKRFLSQLQHQARASLGGVRSGEGASTRAASPCCFHSAENAEAILQVPPRTSPGPVSLRMECPARILQSLDLEGCDAWRHSNDQYRRRILGMDAACPWSPNLWRLPAERRIRIGRGNRPQDRAPALRGQGLLDAA